MRLPRQHPRHMHDRERLLRKLSWLERRLAGRGRHSEQRHLPVHVYEIDGTWFRQAGRRRPARPRS
ncbi:MAG TPA: hypothetical protein VK457_11900 [Chloroflexota bacterium]|nr:hypothetical protein [Chloroflexota bacterium]